MVGTYSYSTDNQFARDMLNINTYKKSTKKLSMGIELK